MALKVKGPGFNYSTHANYHGQHTVVGSITWWKHPPEHALTMHLFWLQSQTHCTASQQSERGLLQFCLKEVVTQLTGKLKTSTPFCVPLQFCILWKPEQSTWPPTG